MPSDLWAESRKRKRKPAPKPSKQAVIWAAEQNLRPWEVKKEAPRKVKRVAPYKPGAEKRRAPVPLPKVTQERYELAKRAPVDLRAREKLAAGLTPQRRKELERDVRKPSSERGLLPTKAERKKMFGGWNPLTAISGDIDYASRFVRNAADALYDITFDDEEQAQLQETLQASTATAAAGGAAVGRTLSSPVQQGMEHEAKSMGFGDETAKDIGEVAGNFIRNVSQGVVGFTPGVVAGATHPLQMAGEVGDFYREFYAPLFQGNLGKFAQNLKESPDMLLDFLGAGGVVLGTGRRVGIAGRAARAAEMVETGPVRAAAKGLVTGKEPLVIGRTEAGEPVTAWGKRIHTRVHKVAGQETTVQRYVPQGAVGLALAEGVEKLRMGGNKRRFRKGVREEVEATRSRVFGEIQAFRAAGREIQDTPGQAKAFDRALIYGGDSALAAQRIRREIEVRERQGLNETQAEQEELQRLGEAATFLEQGATPEFERVVEQGRAIASDTEQFLKQAGLLTDATAERMLMTPAQFLEDVPAVDSPERTSMRQMLEERWPPDEDGAAAPEVELGMAYLDANAISWARRNGADPADFYAEVYSDASYAKSGDIYDVLGQPGDADILAQRGDPSPFGITGANEKARKHQKAHEELLGQHGPERQAAALERATPKHKARVPTVQQRFERIFHELPDELRQKEIARWYKDIWPVFEGYFGADAAAAVRAFLASQAAQSPAGGLGDLLKLLEYKNTHGHWPPKGIISPNAASIARAWDNAMGEDPSGIAAKLSDFYDSAMGRETRTWLQDAKTSAPGVVDRWTLRSDGFLDHNSYSKAGPDAPDPNRYDALREDVRVLSAKRKRTPEEEAQLQTKAAQVTELRQQLSEFYDMTGGPDHYQYEWSSIRLNELHQMFNEQRVHGRNDWAIDEVQALDWFATRSEWGELGGGWDETFRSNTFSIVGEVVGEMRKEWLAEGAKGAIVTKVATNGAHGSVEILGTVEQAAAIAQRLTNDSGQRAYHFFDAGGSPKKGSIVAHAIDIVDNDPDFVYTTMGHITSDLVNEGMLVLPWGDGGLRIVFRDSDGKALPKKGGPTPVVQRNELLERLQELGINAEPLSTRLEVFHAARATHGLYRRDDPRGILARAAAARRRRTEFRVSEVAGRDAAERFVTGLAANSRAYSLAPRAVDDFLENGYRGFVTDDGNAGAAISPDGEIVSVFNSGSFAGAGGHVLVEALAEGGHWLNAYDGFLPPYYSNVGFREVARVPFDEALAPANWNYSLGRPDIVLMSYLPHEPIRRARRYKNFDAAEARAKRRGQEGLETRPVDSILAELADRGDGIPHVTEDGMVLQQWKRTIAVSEGDPVIQGAVRIDEDGVHLALTPAANFSTLIHENAHATLRATLAWLEQGEDPRLERVQQLLGIEAIDDIPTRAQELWARVVEYHAYLGNMPAPQLRQLMSGSSKLMRESYRGGLRQLVGDEFDPVVVEEILSDSAFTTLLDDLINVTYGATREANAVFMPRLGPTSSGRVAGVLRRVGSSMSRGAITPPRKSPVGKGSTNVRFESGEYQYGPDVVANYATSAFRHGVAEELAKEIFHAPYVRPLTRSESGRFVVDDGYRAFVYKTTPGAARILDEQMGMAHREADLYEPGEPDLAVDLEPQELAERIKEEAGQAFAESFPEVGEINRHRLEQLVADKAIVQIPVDVYESYMDAVTGTTMLSAASKFYNRDLGSIGKVASIPFAGYNFLARWNMIGKFAYVTTNTVGAAATATMHNPFWLGEIRKMTDLTSNWSPASLRALDEMVGAGTLEIARVLEEDSALGSLARKERHAYVKSQEVISWPERRIRRALMARELHAAGYTTEEHFAMLRRLADEDPHYRAIFNQIGRNGEDGAIRFRGMSDTEKWIVRRAFFVYGWLRASMRYTLRFPINHPIQAAVMNRIGNQGWEDLQDALEREIGFRGGLPTKITEKDGERLARMIDLSGIFPFASGLEVGRAIAAPGIGLLGGDLDANSIGDMFSPGIEFGMALVLGETPRRMTPLGLLEQTFGPGEGFSGVPGLNWIMRISDPKYTESTTYAPRTRRDVAAAFFFGQLWPRDTKLDSAQESWLKRQPLEISAPIRVQQDLDTLRDRYAQAARTTGEPEVQEWQTALDAHAAYELSSSLQNRRTKDMPEQERALARAKIKAQTLKRFFPEAYADLQALPDDLTAEEVVDEVDSIYNEWVSSQYADVRSYIEEILGAEAVPS